MAIDYSKWLAQVSMNAKLVSDCMDEMSSDLLSGMQCNRFPDDDWRYESGGLFFERVLFEVRKAIFGLLSLSEDNLKARGFAADRFIDELAQRQRKLFECALPVMMFSDDAVLLEKEMGQYFLHYHAIQDREQYRLTAADLLEFFGTNDEFSKSRIDHIDKHLTQLANVIDINKCGWAAGCRPRSAKDMLMFVLPTASQLDSVALGVSYQLLFGRSSAQIHLNMSGLHSPEFTEQKLLHGIENVLLICISICLHAIHIREVWHGSTGNASVSLLSEYQDVEINKYVAAMAGPAVKDDFVYYPHPIGTCLGRVINTNKSHPRVAYKIADVMIDGREVWVPGLDVTLCARNVELADLFQEATSQGYLPKNHGQNEYWCMAHLARNQKAVADLIAPRVSRNNLPLLFFVQRYLAA